MWKNHNINVNMTGQDYLEYKKQTKIKLSKAQKAALPYFFFAIIGIIFLLIYFLSTQESEPVFEGWMNLAPTLTQTSWNYIAKVSFLYAAPFLMLAVVIGWILHGVGFLVVKR